MVAELLDERDGLADGASVVPLLYTLLHLDEVRLVERLLRAAGEVATNVGDEFLRGAYQLIDGLRLLRTAAGMRRPSRSMAPASPCGPVGTSGSWYPWRPPSSGSPPRVATPAWSSASPACGSPRAATGTGCSTSGRVRRSDSSRSAAARSRRRCAGWSRRGDWPSEPPSSPQPHDSGWPVDLIEAYVLAGRAPDAARLVEQVEALASASGDRPWMTGAAAFGAALLEEARRRSRRSGGERSRSSMRPSTRSTSRGRGSRSVGGCGVPGA